jgi:hypothetical protein
MRRPRPLRDRISGHDDGRSGDRRGRARAAHPAGWGDWGPPAASIVRFHPTLITAEEAVSGPERLRTPGQRRGP